jgi:hypothetical protein
MCITKSKNQRRCRINNKVLTIYSAVDKTYTQAIENVDKVKHFIDKKSIFCYHNNAYPVDIAYFYIILSTGCGYLCEQFSVFCIKKSTDS